MRNHTFMDREFGRDHYDAGDHGTYRPGLVFVMMSFVSAQSRETFVAFTAESRYYFGLHSGPQHGAQFLLSSAAPAL